MINLLTKTALKMQIFNNVIIIHSNNTANTFENKSLESCLLFFSQIHHVENDYSTVILTEKLTKKNKKHSSMQLSRVWYNFHSQINSYIRDANESKTFFKNVFSPLVLITMK